MIEVNGEQRSDALCLAGWGGVELPFYVGSRD